jgi:hypothetical protein
MKRERGKVIEVAHLLLLTLFLGVNAQIRIRNGKVREVLQTENMVEVTKYQLDLNKKRSVYKLHERILPKFSLLMKPRRAEKRGKIQEEMARLVLKLLTIGTGL